ncbi:MAG: hypothetical protein RI920_1458 [Pseudomonadota bacterium]
MASPVKTAWPLLGWPKMPDHRNTGLAAVDTLLFFKAMLMGILAGLTELLPISSTGHLILAGSLLDFARNVGPDKAKVFDIAIQSGAIFAIVLVYWQRLRDTLVGLGSEPRAQRFAMNVVVGFLPAAVIGLAFGKVIKAHLFTPVIVASSFIVGGLIILWAERRASSVSTKSYRVATVDDLSLLDALKIGFIQCLGMVPGTSRSGATIIGGMFIGLSRKAST